MVRRLMRSGHECVVFDLNPENGKRLASEGAKGTASLEDFVSQLQRPRVAWVMVPAGEPTERTVMTLAEKMEAGDIIIIDGAIPGFKHFDVVVAPVFAEAIHGLAGAACEVQVTYGEYSHCR